MRLRTQVQRNQVFNKNETRMNKNHPEGEKNKQTGRRLVHSQHNTQLTKDNGSAQDCRHQDAI